MKSLFIGLVVLLGSAAHAAEDLNFSEYRKFLMSGSKESGQKLAIQTTCTTKSGKTYRIGDSGYDTCFEELRNAQNSKQAVSKTQKNPEDSTTTIHIGSE